MKPRVHPILAAWVATVLLGLAASPGMATEREFQLHGFAAAGFVSSTGNDFFGDSTRGSFELWEAGLNGSVRITNRLFASAQVLARRAGETDTGDLRLDYALLDYRAVSKPAFRLGLRAGKVKNPFGLYNETRDVPFTRPSILLPVSVYFEGQGFRDLFFSGEGGQIYTDFDHHGGNTSLVVSMLPSFEPSGDNLRALVGGSAFQGELTLEDPIVARALREWRGGRYRFGITYAGTDLRAESPPPIPSGVLGVDLIVYSFQRNGERWTLTAEMQELEGEFQFGPVSFPIDTSGYYLQAEARLHPDWKLLARYDVQDGVGNEAFDDAEDVTLGARWSLNPRWAVWMEYHRIEGTASVPRLDNPGVDPATFEDPWNLFLIMAGVRF